MSKFFDNFGFVLFERKKLSTECITEQAVFEIQEEIRVPLLTTF